MRLVTIRVSFSCQSETRVGQWLGLGLGLGLRLRVKG